MKRKILVKGDEMLEKKSHKVTKFDKKLHNLLDDMRETLQEVNGAGLAASQVGVLRRIFIINDGENIIEFVNPEIAESRGEQFPQEGCLSYPGHYGITKRPDFVRVTAFDRDGNPFEREGDGFIAQVLSHEYDHLEGVLFLDKVVEWMEEEEEDGE